MPQEYADAQARHTLGGGRVLDANAPARKRRGTERSRYLGAMEKWLAGHGVDDLLVDAPIGLAAADIERITAMPIESLALTADTKALQTKQGRYFFAKTHWQAQREAAIAALRTFHANSSQEAGVEITRLRRMTTPAMPEASWRALVEDLIGEGTIARNGPWLHLPEHRVVMSAQESALADKIMPLIVAGGYDPPWVRDLGKAIAASETSVRETLHKLARQGVVHQIVPDLFYAVERVRELANIADQLGDERGDVAAATFRDHIRLGRKRAIQILEFFDRVGYTRRVRKAHRLRGEHQGLF